MGACFSCFGHDEDEDDINERTSLLNSHYPGENVQEELLKQQQRQNELNSIVNELSDKLIDVSTFLSNPSTAQTPLTPNLLYLTTSLQPQTSDEAPVKQYPHVLGPEERARILQEVEALPEEVKQFRVEREGDLFIKF